jgi:hypothetical protein
MTDKNVTLRHQLRRFSKLEGRRLKGNSFCSQHFRLSFFVVLGLSINNRHLATGLYEAKINSAIKCFFLCEIFNEALNNLPYVASNIRMGTNHEFEMV